MTSISFFGGVGEIGGNKILVEDRGTRIFLDYGKSFSVWGKYFEEYLKPSSSRGIDQFWKLGLLPDIEGVYRPDLLEFAGAKVHTDTTVDAVLLSHAHQDHAAYISFLDDRIPVYCSPTTKTVLEAVEAVGKRDLETEVTNYKPRPLLTKDYRKPAKLRNIITVDKKISIGSIEAEFLPVDHSIPGACAMILHCSDATIVYSGDLRLHGTFGHLTQEFAEHANLAKSDVFLCEGTRINSSEGHGEPYVKANATKVVQESKGIVLVDYSWKDTTRLLSLYEIAKATGRKLLIPFRTAHYLEALKPVFPQLPSTNDPDILLFIEKAGSGTYDDSDYKDSWKKPYLSYSNLVRADWVNKHQNEIIACLGYFDFLDVLDINPVKGSAYIHSSSEPYNEEMEFDEIRCDNWLGHFDLPKHQIHASGHAPREDLFKVAETVKPKRLFPIHTVYPEEFLKTSLKIEKPEIGKPVSI